MITRDDLIATHPFLRDNVMMAPRSTPSEYSLPGLMASVRPILASLPDVAGVVISRREPTGTGVGAFR